MRSRSARLEASDEPRQDGRRWRTEAQLGMPIPARGTQVHDRDRRAALFGSSHKAIAGEETRQDSTPTTPKKGHQLGEQRILLVQGEEATASRGRLGA